MRRARFGFVLALAACAGLTACACGRSAPTVSASSSPSVGPGWVELAQFTGQVRGAQTWTYGPAVQVKSRGTLRAVGSLKPAANGYTLDLAAGLNPEGDGGASNVGTVAGPIPSGGQGGRLHFDILSASPVKPGFYRFVVQATDTPAAFDVTMYVKE
jgi:hypothetical protein